MYSPCFFAPSSLLCTNTLNMYKYGIRTGLGLAFDEIQICIDLT